MKSTFSVYFYLKKGDLLTGGYAPIMGRIMIDGVSKQFATQLKVISEHWNQKFQQVERT